MDFVLYKLKSRFQFAPIWFFESQGIIQNYVVPQGQMGNQYFYWEVLLRFWKIVMHVRPTSKHLWVLHHDNYPWHNEIYINGGFGHYIKKIWFLSFYIHTTWVHVTFYSQN